MAKTWEEKMAEKYPLDDYQKALKVSDMPFIENDNGERYYFDNGTEYIQALERAEDNAYLQWIAEKGL